MSDHQDQETHAKPNGVNTREEYNAHNADLYRAVVAKVGHDLPINIWMTRDWRCPRTTCTCGEESHVLVHWRTLDDAVTGHLILHGGWTRQADCHVDPTPVKSDFSGLDFAPAAYPGFAMTLMDGHPTDLTDLH